jgi:hypothetical protein
VANDAMLHKEVRTLRSGFVDIERKAQDRAMERERFQTDRLMEKLRKKVRVFQERRTA